jgi:hypothetical protein
MDENSKKQARRVVARLSRYQKVFSGPDGHWVLYDLMKSHGVLTTNFDKDPYVLAAREGERGVILRIMSLLKVDPKTLEERIDEHVQEP